MSDTFRTTDWSTHGRTEYKPGANFVLPISNWGANRATKWKAFMSAYVTAFFSLWPPNSTAFRRAQRTAIWRAFSDSHNLKAYWATNITTQYGTYIAANVPTFCSYRAADVSANGAADRCAVY